MQNDETRQEMCQDLGPRCRAAALIPFPARRTGAFLLERISLADAQVERGGPKKVSVLSDSSLLLSLTSFSSVITAVQPWWWCSCWEGQMLWRCVLIDYVE